VGQLAKQYFKRKGVYIMREKKHGKEEGLTSKSQSLKFEQRKWKLRELELKLQQEKHKKQSVTR